MATTISMVNDVLRRLGKQRITALDTGGTTTHAEIERVIVETSKRLQTKAWMFNTIPTTEAVPNTTTKKITVANLASVQILHIDAIDDEPWNNYTQRSGFLYDIENATDLFTSTVNVQLILELPLSDLPEAFAQYVVSSSAQSFNRNFIGNSQRDAHLRDETQNAQTVVNSEEIRSTDVNLLDGSETSSILGRPAYKYLQGINNA